METKTESKKKPPRRIFSAQEKARAVLEIWTNARKPVEVAREMDIAGALLDLERFHDEIAALDHRRKRSLGSGHLHETFKDALSRHDIDNHIGAARKEQQKVQREKSKSVH